MRIILTGIFAFIIWSAISTYWYIYKIKDFRGSSANVTAVEYADEPEAEEVAEKPAEAHVENPGLFTVRHEFDRSEFIEEATLPVYVQQVANFLEQNSSRQIVISGYTDSRGPTAYNQKLAMRRSLAVRDYLAARKIPQTRIQVHAFGEDDPIADNSTDEGRALNRRTTIEIK
jgi:OOP family OmpA-OmpF porin